MTYNNFDEWYDSTDIKSDKLEPTFVMMVKEFMHRAWDAALNNIDLEITIGEDPIAIKIKELLTTINDAELIDCICDQKQIKQGYRCGCGRGKAVMRSGIELGIYLKKLREGLK